jgi:dienelactone hydrolase
MAIRILISALMLKAITSCALADDNVAELAAKLRELDATVLTKDGPSGKPSEMLAKDARARRDAANRRETENWKKIHSKAEWEAYRDQRIKALKDSLGHFPEAPAKIEVHVTGTIHGDGFVIENIVFESRPGLVVSANRYLPEKPGAAMPGIVICHSHHNPKTQSELQDMGIGWSRQGCVVIIPDMLGHGERRQHPFKDAASFPGPFRVSRQDYYFRYNEGMQLNLVGESLIGWMVWDLMRCVDVLLQQPGIDPKRIAMLGSVAGGGDPVAVAGALDSRIGVVAPFNFGGPQPESQFPLPADPDYNFNYAGGGSWESTRNLRLSCRDGFLPWVIVGSIAPRKLLYGHEFAWDQEHDPVWARLKQIYAWYDLPDNLAGAHGRGNVSGKPPEATHCNNIGPVQRESMGPALKRWLGIDPPKVDEKARRKLEELLCVTEKCPLKMKPLYELLLEMVDKIQRNLARDSDSWQLYRGNLVRVLGDVAAEPHWFFSNDNVREFAGINVSTFSLKLESSTALPLVLLEPPTETKQRLPCVIMFSQEGKSAILKVRCHEIAELLRSGIKVCLVDLRGTGELSAGNGRGRGSAATAVSSTELMIGQTLTGARLCDLRTVVRLLRPGKDEKQVPIALWGDSFTEPNSQDTNLAVPLDAEPFPKQSEPMGGLLAILGALYEPDIRAVAAVGGLSDFRSVLQSPFCYLPHDVIVPGVLTCGDNPDFAAKLAPRPLLIWKPVDGQNRLLGENRLKEVFAPTRQAYAKSPSALTITNDPKLNLADWFIEQLTK